MSMCTDVPIKVDGECMTVLVMLYVSSGYSVT